MDTRVDCAVRCRAVRDLDAARTGTPALEVSNQCPTSYEMEAEVLQTSSVKVCVGVPRSRLPRLLRLDVAAAPVVRLIELVSSPLSSPA